MPATSASPPSAAAQWRSTVGGWKSSTTSAAPLPVAGATSVRERRFAGRKSTGGAPARLRLSVSGGLASRKIVPFATSASRRIRPPTLSRAMSSIVGGGAAASSSVQIAVSTVDLPLDASPTSAHTEPGVSSRSLAARYPWIETRLSGGGTGTNLPAESALHV